MRMLQVKAGLAAGRGGHCRGTSASLGDQEGGNSRTPGRDAGDGRGDGEIIFKLHLRGKISLGWVVCGSEAECWSKMILPIHCGNQRSFRKTLSWLSVLLRVNHHGCIY